MDAVISRLSASEMALGDIRTTMTSQAQNADSMRTLLEQLAGQVTQVMASHDKLHQDLIGMRSGSFPGGEKRRANISVKDLKLELLGESGNFRQQWVEWSDKVKDFLALRIPDTPDLRSKLGALE